MEHDIEPELRRRIAKTLLIAAGSVAALMVAAVTALTLHWPFSDANVRASLEEGFGGQVTFASYQEVYWPHPGLIAEGITLRRSADPAVPPLATAQRLVVTDRWTTVLTLQHRLRLIKLQGVKVTIPAAGSPARLADFPPGNDSDFSGPTTFLEMVKVEDAMLEVDEAAGNFVLPVSSLEMENVMSGRPATFSVDVKLQQPAAAIHASGSLGPLHSTRLAEMPLAVNFTVTQLQLADIGAMDGALNATGKLNGTLGAIAVEAQTQTDGFAVSGGAPTAVQASVSAVVNGLNADIQLRGIDGQTGNTRMHVAGAVAGQPKQANLQIGIEQGRLEDVMRPFTAQAPAMTAALRGSGRVRITPSVDGVSFLDRVDMDAQFSLADARITDRESQTSLSAFSARARGLKTQDGAVSLTVTCGPVALRHGFARTQDLAITLPGAEIHMVGGFDLKRQKADLTGNLTMKPEIQAVTTGVNAALLKPLSPLFRHGRKPDAVTVVPIQVTGTKTYKVTGNFFGRTAADAPWPAIAK